MTFQKTHPVVVKFAGKRSVEILMDLLVSCVRDFAFVQVQKPRVDEVLDEIQCAESVADS